MLHNDIQRRLIFIGVVCTFGSLFICQLYRLKDDQSIFLSLFLSVPLPVNNRFVVVVGCMNECRRQKAQNHFANKSSWMLNV